MKLLFFAEAHLQQAENGKYYSADQSFSYHMFKRYLPVFDEVLVVARASTVLSSSMDENTLVSNGGVQVLPLPHYIGPYQYLRNRKKLGQVLRTYIDSHPDAAAICRLPGILGTAAAKYLRKNNRAYGVEVVGDPMDVFAPGAFNHPLRPVFRCVFTKNLRTAVRGAAAVLYVTRSFLQKRYPPAENQHTTYASDVILPPEAYVSNPKKLRCEPPFSILSVGSLDAMYKAPDVVIDAMALLKKKGLNVSLQWIGDGRYRAAMEDYASKAGVADRVKFIGRVRMAADVRKYLDASDLFLLPSRTEGLPRAMVEAMARGLPCIGTMVGGIPELLDEEALVPVNNPTILAEKIVSFLTIPGLADLQAARNLKEAEEYAFERMQARRILFFEYLKDTSRNS